MDGKKRHFAPFTECAGAITAGCLPGIVLCMLIVYATGAEHAGAATETFLATRDITISGRVTSPSCTVRLDNSRMVFGSAASAEEIPRGASQQLNMIVSECDVDGVGMLLKADHWPEMPERGTLRSVSGREASRAYYYTVGPGQESDDAWPLVALDDTQASQVKLASGHKKDEGNDAVFMLSAVRYWYRLKSPLKVGDERVIPLTVSVHQALNREDKTVQDELNGTFTIELSWR